MKICVVTPRYMISGVALAQTRFARALAAAGHDVDLVIGRVDPGLEVPPAPGVKVILLHAAQARGMFVPLWRYLRRVRPEIVFSAEDHLNALVLIAAAAARSKAKISGSSRVTPFDTYSSVLFSKRWWLKQIMRVMQHRADTLTCVSQDMVGQYRHTFANAPHRCVYNIVDDGQARDKIAAPLDEPWFGDGGAPVVVGAGTLAEWKRFGDLIEAIGILRDRGRDVRLIVLGDGPLRGELEAQVERLGLGDRVKLPGFIANPLPYFARAAAFVLSSRVEGLPNVLVEAMMAGATPVATDCPTGPREVLDDGRFGYLVPVADPAALATGIGRALDHPIAPDLLAEAVRPFAERTVIEQHLALLGLQ